MRKLALAGAVVWAACGTPEENLDQTPYIEAIGAQALSSIAHIEVPTQKNITIIPDAGVELRLYPGQPIKNNGIRAEFSFDFPFVDGDTVSYTWQVWIPNDFTPDPQNRWWIFGDFHDQPDPRLGETWDTYVPKSAPVIVGYGHVTQGQVVEGFTADATTDALGLTYGTDYRGIGMVDIQRETWVTVRLDITWSQSDAGHLTMFVDGTPRLTAQGPNMLNAYQHYLKVGQYRDPDIQSDNRVRISHLAIHACAGDGGCEE